MHEPQTWRELLGQSIQDSQERQRIANELGVNSVTLMRWVRHESTPRMENLQRLLNAVPQRRELFLALIKKEFEDFSAVGEAGELTYEPTAIPAEFYVRVVHTLATIPNALRFWSLCDLILQQAIKQLDPHRLGLAITVAQCMPPSRGGKVRSLREIIGRGTPPWESNLDQRLILLGAESLAGSAAISGHLITNQDLKADSSRAPGYQGDLEESAAAAPIMRAGDVAGSLLVSSVRPDYFSPLQSTLIENYAELIALAFDPGDFYEASCIALGTLPSFQVQQSRFANFRQRVVETVLQASRNQQPMTSIQADLLVWRQLEEELVDAQISL